MSAGFVLVPGITFGLLATVGLARRRWPMHPEMGRKIFHAGGGVLCLALPMWFDRVWPVALLAAIIVMLLARSSASVLSGNTRAAGVVCFPAGVTLVFGAAGGGGVLYSVPVLILAFADAGAALAGTRFGCVRVVRGKTLEGSCAFFAIAFCAALAVLAMNGRAEPVSAALMVAACCTLVEALSPHGLDNLLIPVSAYAVLRMLWN